MANNGENSLLDTASDSLSPLEPSHRHGLAAVAALATLSLVSSTTALLYLTFKLVRWHIERRKTSTYPNNSSRDVPFVGDEFRIREPAKPQQKPQLNQFLVLIFNLLLADIHQAAAFFINAHWAGRNIIDVRSPVCFAQGWLISTGDLASSCFITAIAVHTYLAVVWNYKPPQWAVYATMVGLWVFDYFLVVIGLVITSNGREHGGFYVRAVAWVSFPPSPLSQLKLTPPQCWVNIAYETYRLVFHYLFIFLSLVITSVLYTLILLSLRKHSSSLPTTTTTTSSSLPPSPGTFSPHTSPHTTFPHPSPSPSHAHAHHHKAFLLYPVIYVLCTAPVALARIVSMAGVPVSISFFCAAGALITSNGWLDVLLWGVTRQQLLLGEVDSEDTGLDTFIFMRTPRERRYGNIVWVEGGEGVRLSGGGARVETRLGTGTGEGREGVKGVGRSKSRNGGKWGRQKKTASQESLRGFNGGYESENAGVIQLEVMTSVVVEGVAGEREKR